MFDCLQPSFWSIHLLSSYNIVSQLGQEENTLNCSSLSSIRNCEEEGIAFEKLLRDSICKVDASKQKYPEMNENK